MLIKSEDVIYKPIQNRTYKLKKAREAIDVNPILSEVLGALTAQTAKGIAKYPNTVNVDDYSVIGWIDHAIEEGIDQIVYLTALKQKIVEGK